MFHKIINVFSKEDLILEVEFENKIKKEYDLKNILEKWEIFNELKNNNPFKNVKIDTNGYGISWNENIDLSCEEIWNNGRY